MGRIVLDLAHSFDLDVATVDMLSDLRREVDVEFVNVHPEALEMLQRAGLVSPPASSRSRPPYMSRPQMMITSTKKVRTDSTGWPLMAMNSTIMFAPANRMPPQRPHSVDVQTP